MLCSLRHSDDPVGLFLEDDRFIKWIVDPDEETIAYWEKWMEENPDHLPDLFKARELARDIVRGEKPEENGPLASAIWEGIQDRLKDPLSAEGELAGIASAGHRGPVPLVPRIRRRRWPYYLAAASLAGLLLTAGLLYYHSSPPHSPAAPSIVRSLVQDNLERTNLGTGSQAVYLVDGSRITLQPGARIRHMTFLQKNKREVYLEGNAFFEVAKDAGRPFYVYTKDLVVRVLGTNFSLQTNSTSGEVTVVVRTGKVAVSRQTATSSPVEPIILTSNQKVSYKMQAGILITSKPGPADGSTGPSPQVVNFSFEETPVTKVFELLEDAYGIPLHYNEKTFAVCKITTDLTDETFEERIKIICEAIGAHYRIGQEGVFIDGNPCK